MDTEVVAEELVEAVEQLSDAERARLRSITDLAPGETDSLTGALDEHPGPLADVALKLMCEWDQMKDAERVASLLALREILIRVVPRERLRRARGEALTHPSVKL